MDNTLTAPVFNIQHFSIHDGPGIRVTVFLKGCPLKCLWCANPESGTASPQLMTYVSKCTACGLCISKCPEEAISVAVENSKPVAVTDRSKCVACGICTQICPNAVREVAGQPMTVDGVLHQVLADKLFLDESGGGMTLSGGECLLHPAFSRELLRCAREAGLHTAVESCCYAPREVVDAVFPYVDLGLLDIKHMDSTRHRAYTGVPNEQILANIHHIYHDLKVPVTIRIPVIPGYNDSDDNIAATARFVAGELGGDVHIHLLPYHRMGDAKSSALGKDRHLDIPIPQDSRMRELKQLVESFGITAQIGG